MLTRPLPDEFLVAQQNLEMWRKRCSISPDTTRQWEIAWSMLACGKEVATRLQADDKKGGSTQTGRDIIRTLASKLAPPPECTQYLGPDWVDDCCRKLWPTAPVSAAPEVSSEARPNPSPEATSQQIRREGWVPVALGESAGGEGKVVRLELELVGQGGSNVFHDPEDSLETYADEKFVESMQKAYEAACLLAGGETPAGCWRMRELDQRPLREVAGGSAGGAAARGWYHILRGWWIDPGIVVLSTVDSEGTLNEIDFVKAKVEAIWREAVPAASDKCFDTIAVVEKNYSEAAQALRGCLPHGGHQDSHRGGHAPLGATLTSPVERVSLATEEGKREGGSDPSPYIEDDGKAMRVVLVGDSAAQQGAMGPKP
ncbi:MAG: hypothetical protein HYZ53_12285 [Planctomycetes bacterium]|nr:hypothetical protein [Planctomycetota bacterium]